MAGDYIEHRSLEVHGILMAESTLQSGERKVWVGHGGLEGRWVTPGEFRELVSAMTRFADVLGPSDPRPQSAADATLLEHIEAITQRQRHRGLVILDPEDLLHLQVAADRAKTAEVTQ